MKKLGKLGVFIAVVLLMTSGLAFSGCIEDDEDEELIGFQATRSEIMIFWDPSDSFSNEIIAMHNMYETLTRYEPEDDEIEGILAEDWDVDEDGTTWTFELREGVEFHTGGEMTAEDVKYSIERTMDRGRGAAFIWDAVEEIEVVDDYTVEFQLSEPAPLDLIAASSYGGFIFSKEQGEEVDDLHEWFNEANSAGTGPYMPETWDEEERLVLDRHDDYWQGWNEDQFDRVVIRNIPEATTARLEIEGGDVHYVERLPYEEREAAAEHENIDIIETESFQNMFGLMNTEAMPFDDPVFREAISYALPYEDIVNEIYHGAARQAKGSIPYGMWGHGEDLMQYEEDLEKAQELLEDSEYSDELDDITIEATYTEGNVMQERVLTILDSNLDELGIDMDIRGMPWDPQWEKARAEDPEERQDLFMFYWWPDVPSPYSWMANLWMSEEEPFFNLAYYSNPEVDELIEEARTTAGIDRDEAEELYIEAQELILEDTPSLFVVDEMYARAVRTELGGFEDNPSYPHVVWWYDCYWDA